MGTGTHHLAAVLATLLVSGCASSSANAPDSKGDTYELAQPVPDVEAAARAFKLYYAERVERALIAYNRFMLFGDTTFAINIRKAGVARKGNTFEVVPGPNDNNSIGTSTRATWYAYKVFRSRTAALSLQRMFEGLYFIATVSGHDGVTGRNAYPNWTLFIDGRTGEVKRTREGVAVTPPIPVDKGLEALIVATFFKDTVVTYRGEPKDILLNYMPAQEVGPYAVTYAFTMLPEFLRVSDCCTSLMQVPEPYLWAHAFFSNHNSRDNFPDLAFGYLAAKEAMDDLTVEEDVRKAAARAWQAGQMVGDLIEANGGRIMTVLEGKPYTELAVSGVVRPDGMTEVEDLGSMSDCQMTFLARALSSKGLALPLPELPEPGALDDLVAPLLDPSSGCLPEGSAHTCKALAEAICGKTWGQLNELTVNGKGLVDLAWELETQSPGTAEKLLGHFYDNFDQPLNSMLAVREYARIRRDEALLAEASKALAEMTAVSRELADLIYGRINQAEQARRRYWTALIDAQAGQPAADLGDFAPAKDQMGRIEALLTMEDTRRAPLLSDAEIAKRVQARLAGASDAAKKRYQEAFGDTYPVRRTETGYEARVFTQAGPSDWRPVDTPHHNVIGGIELLEALPLCVTAPEVLDCTWARLGCRRCDLDSNGKVDEADSVAHRSLAERFAGADCGPFNAWCDGSDLDHTGRVDSQDVAFMEAAQGCFYER